MPRSAESLAKCRAYSAAWSKKNPDRQREYSRLWRQRNPDRHKLVVLKSVYGLTTLDAMIALLRRDFGGNCDSCGVFEKLHVDHSHTTGVARGMVCRACNVAIGHAKESPERLRRAASYLENFNGEAR